MDNTSVDPNEWKTSGGSTQDSIQGVNGRSKGMLGLAEEGDSSGSSRQPMVGPEEHRFWSPFPGPVDDDLHSLAIAPTQPITMDPQVTVGPKDPRPPINQVIRKWFADITGIAIPDLVHNAKPPSPNENLHYGDIGDHRWHELSTIASLKVLFPSRKFIYPQTREEINNIQTTDPETLNMTHEEDNHVAGRTIHEVLLRGLPCLYHQSIPEKFQSMRLNVGNDVARTIYGIKETVLMAESPWTGMSLKPTLRSQRWEQFLALGLHPGAFVWTEIPHVGDPLRPLLVEQALGMTPVTSSGAKKWGERYFCYQPFASRMHISQDYEFRWQLVGFHLVFLLVWEDLASATLEALQYRDAAVKKRDWSHCIYSSKAAWEEGDRPVSKWYQVITSPGSLL